MRRALRWLAQRPLPMPLRMRLYRWSGLRFGHNSYIEPGVSILGGGLNLAEGCYVNRGCQFDCGEARIILGKNVYVGFGARFITSSHESATRRQRAGINTYRPIVVGDGVWIGAGAIVLPGVTLGDGCIVAAGAVVTTDTKPDALYTGVPATYKKDLP